MKASVIITNYNHADTLARAVSSVHNQKTNFPFEIIIADDGSDDDSVHQIVKILNARPTHTNRVYIMTPSTHVGMMKNYIRSIKVCTGDYIAFCDSDDYWIDMNKLQHQVDFMDALPHCLASYSGLKICNNAGKELSIVDNLPFKVSYDKMLCGACIPSPTVMVDRVLCRDIVEQDDYSVFHYWDYPLFLYFALFTDFWKFTPSITAVYTKQIESCTQTESRSRRWKYIWETFKIKLFFINNYNCEFNVKLFIAYRLLRDVYSIIFKRWNK